MRGPSIPGISLAVLLAGAAAAHAQQPEPDTRQEALERGQADKVETLHPYVESRPERIFARIQQRLVNQHIVWYPFLQNAYSGGGLALGAGYRTHVSPYNFVDVRGSYSVKSYKLAEAEFVAPRLFKRRAELSILGGWRDATEVGFYGLGSDPNSDRHLTYGFEESRGAALLTMWPTRRMLMLRGGFELSRWDLKAGSGSYPSIDTEFTPDNLPGVLQETTYAHVQATVGIDNRKWVTAERSSGYARRGGFYAITGHDYSDDDDRFGFRQVDYEAVQHIPILREAWVLSLRGRVETAYSKDDQQVPFYLLPSLGGASSLRGYSSWRFRGRNSILLQGEWRIIVNRAVETALFYDAGKIEERSQDLDLDNLVTDYGFGARFHSARGTALRVELAHGREGYRVVFATSAAF
jgi:Omp85 superfamily domain